VRVVNARIERIAIGLLAAVVVGATYLRLYYGVNLTDESFYTVVPYHLVHGGQVFVSSPVVAQGFVGLLLYPIVRLYTAIAGLHGIVLFMRHVQFVFSLAVGGAVWWSLREALGTRRSLLVALVPVAYAPYELHAPSYNILGSGFLAAGCVLGFLCLRRPELRGPRIAAGACLGLTMYCYPPLAGTVVVALVLRFVLADRAGRKRMWLDVAVAAVPVLVMGGIVLSVGITRFLHDVRSRSQILSTNSHKLTMMRDDGLLQLRHPLLVLALLAVVILAWRRLPLVVVVVCVVLPLLIVPKFHLNYSTSLEYVAHLAWFAPVLYPIVRGRMGATQLLVAVWVPGIVGGFTTGLSSRLGGLSVGVGALPAAIVSVAFLVWASSVLLPKRVDVLAILPGMSAIAVLLVIDVVPTYFDGDIFNLHARIHGGAFAGLVTDAAQKRTVDDLRHDLGAIGPRCTIVALDQPGAYLLTHARIANGAEYLAHHDDLLARYREHGFPDVVVLDEYTRAQHDELLDTLRAPPYHEVVRRPFYSVYRTGKRC
jgi:hypothetical protein